MTHAETTFKLSKCCEIKKPTEPLSHIVFDFSIKRKGNCT